MQTTVRELLLSRLELGKKRYGHGVKIGSDTRKWGTPSNDWFEMMQEELLDGMIYCAADFLRSEGGSEVESEVESEAEGGTEGRSEGGSDDNNDILNWIEETINYVEETDQPKNEHHEILRNLCKSMLLSMSVQRKRQKANAVLASV